MVSNLSGFQIVRIIGLERASQVRHLLKDEPMRYNSSRSCRLERQHTRPPRALVRVSIVVALSLLGDQLLYAVLPVMHEAMGIPVTAVGLILSANRLVRLVTNSLAGYVIERFGRRWPFIGSLLLGGLTTIAYGGLSGVWVFLIARLLWGTAWSFLRMEGLSTALDVATVSTRGRMMGIFQSISRLGGAIAMLVGGS